MAKLANLARVTTATTGTGTITLGAAVSGCLSFAQAGVQNGDIVSYGIKDGSNSEVGTGTYTSSGTTLTRSVTKSTNSNAAINLSGTAEVFITARAEDLVFSTVPQGRLTLTSATPVMATSVSAATTLYYTPYIGACVPLYDGSSFTARKFAELSATTTDTTKSPAAIGANKVNDWFVWDDSGTIRLSHGPDWTNDTTRSAGTALVMVNGIFLNNASITNGPAASRGTYVGTTRSDANSKLNYIFGAVSAGGTPGVFLVWNAYNRVPIQTFVGDSTDTWTYAVNDVWRAANSASVLVSTVRGLDEDGVTAEYFGIANAASGASAQSGVGLDSTTSKVGTVGFTQVTGTSQTIISKYSGLPGLGYHIIYALEHGTSTNTVTWVGDGGQPGYIQSGLHATLWQ